MFALRAHDDADAELLRLRSDLLAFVVDEIARPMPPSRGHALSGPVADAITETAAAATRAELIDLGQGLAREMVSALRPELAERLPALVKAAVADALAEQSAPPAPRADALWLSLALNGLAFTMALAALLMR